MPLELAPPLEEEFELERTDQRFGIKDGSTTVTIKQATQRGHEKRAALFSNIVRELSSNDEADMVRLIQRFSFEELKRIESYLTMAGCNILDENGKPLFRFDAKGRIPEGKFNDAWGQLPPLVAEEIHEKVLEVNVDWQPEGEVS